MATTKPTPVVAPVRLARVAVVGTSFLALTATFRPVNDPMFLPKTTVVWLGAAIVLAALSWHAIAQRRVPSLPRWTVLAIFAVPAALALSLLATDSVQGSLYGYPFHYAGVLTYLSLAILAAAIVVLGRMDEAIARQVVLALVAGALANALYGVIQVLELDPVRWAGKEGELIGFAANRNFVAPLIAAGVGPLVVLAANASVAQVRRIVAGALILVLAALALVTRTLQGPLLVLAAPIVPALAWQAGRLGEQRTRGLRLGAVGAGLVVAVLALGVFEVGPASAVGRDKNVVSRVAFWQTGVSMAADAPILGVGADRYGVHVRDHRPAAHAEVTDGQRAAIDPHNVPLAMLANGGIVSLLAHLGFVAFVGLRLLRGLFGDLAPDRRRWLAAAGSIWLVYQVQSLVSIDMPPLVALHWLSAGAVLALTAGEAPKARRVPQVGPEVDQVRSFASGTLAGLLALALAVPAISQFRAMATMQQAAVHEASGRPNPAIRAYLEVADAMPWWSEPLVDAGNVARAEEEWDEAEAYYLRAEEAGDGFVQPLISLINLYAITGRLDEATAASDRLFEADDQVPIAWFGRSRLERSKGNLDEAERYAREAVDRGGLPDAWLELGRVLVEQGRLDEARAAFEAGLADDRPGAAGPSLREGLRDVRERQREQRREAAGG